METSCGTASLDAHCEWVDGEPVWNASFYESPMCEDGCAAYDGEVGCAADSACRWLVRGCEAGGLNVLTEAGCYPVEDCTADSCVDGQSCETVIYDPCYNQTCEACAAQGSVCM